MGKTAYAMSLFGKVVTLEVNCMGETSPELQSFRHHTHRCVLLDEAAPQMVLQNRKLFQAPNSMVQLAQSKTGCHSYEVYLNDALLVISSNHWVEALALCGCRGSRQQGHHHEPIAMMIVFCSSEGTSSMRAPGRGPCHGQWCLQW